MIDLPAPLVPAEQCPGRRYRVAGSALVGLCLLCARLADAGTLEPQAAKVNGLAQCPNFERLAA